tara:strand:- start:91 stop:1557 length:1467 start_codon:yes stop_codon:yes gene_type:complete
MKKSIFCLISIFYLSANAIAQIDTSSNTIISLTLNGTILDENNIPLPYVNIISLNTGKGTISNENGNFSLDISSLNDTNIIRYQCIGYKTTDHKIESLKSNSIILLSENIYTLDEVVVLGITPNPEKIVKNILAFKDSNYRTIPHKKQVFIRERNTFDILNLKLNFKKSNFPSLTSEVIQKLEENIPKHTQSYSDLLTNIYINKNKIKFEPIKSVALKEKDITELKNLAENIQNDLSLNDGEYLRIKTGLIGTNKVSLSFPDSSATLVKGYTSYIRDALYFSTFEDEEQWEFLHNPNKYNFKIIGGTSVNNESVYIIDFTAKKRGRFEGRLYVSIATYALIRADYKYAPNKLGKDFHMLGFGYSETNFSGSIYFEKNKNNYNLKYFSFQNSNKFNVNRKVTFIKKKKSFLINKKINALKLGLDITQENKFSIELLVVGKFQISKQDFEDFEETKYIDVTYVNQFDKSLWENHTTIAPTQKMKDYKKIE